MKIVRWNIERMNNWFVDSGKTAFRKDNFRLGISKLTLSYQNND